MFVRHCPFVRAFVLNLQVELFVPEIKNRIIVWIEKDYSGEGQIFFGVFKINSYKELGLIFLNIIIYLFVFLWFILHIYKKSINYYTYLYAYTHIYVTST